MLNSKRPNKLIWRLLTFKQLALAELIDLYYLDESGFVRSQSVSYTWAKRGTRAILPYQASCNQRVNVLGALHYRAKSNLLYECRTSSWKTADFMAFLWQTIAGLDSPVGQLPQGWVKPARPKIVVLDNYAVHKNKTVAAMQTVLLSAGVSLYYLPPYSPQLNLIEAQWRQIKYQELPKRSYKDSDSLLSAIKLALATRAA